MTPTRVLSVRNLAIPTDLYFGCLDGEFTSEADMDLACEVAVGRAPVTSMREMRAFVEKTLEMEKLAASPTTRNMLSLGEKMDGITLSGNLLERLHSLYPAGSRFSRLYDSFSEEFGWWDVVTAIGSYDFYIVNHVGHSNQQYGMRLASTSIPYLTTTHPFFGFTQGCLSGDLTERNWASQMVLNEKGGAAAMVANSSYGWYTPGGNYEGASQLVHRMFYDSLFKEQIPEVGRALYRAKERLIPWAIQDVYLRWSVLETNLLGDPELRLKFPAPESR